MNEVASWPGNTCSKGSPDFRASSQISQVQTVVKVHEKLAAFDSTRVTRPEIEVKKMPSRNL
jgi:hypothetical protein